MTPTKSVFASKTFWINVISIAIAILLITDPAAININPSHIVWVMGVLNIFLRFLTTGSVSLTGNKSGQ